MSAVAKLSTSDSMKTNSPNEKKDPINSRFEHLSPDKKLVLALQLYHDAWALKQAALEAQHPQWNDRQVNKTLKQIFSHART